MSHGLPWGASPIDLADEAPDEVKSLDAGPDTRRQSMGSGLGWAAQAMVMSSLALLALNSHAFANWADQLPVTRLSEPVVALADGWHDAAGRLGLNAVVDRVEAAATAMRKAPRPNAHP